MRRNHPAATIGAWGATYRPSITVRRAPYGSASFGPFSQIQRMGNPLINELIIGTGSKDYWSMSQPKDDAQFAHFDLDPLLARVFNAIYGINIPTPPRTDLLPSGDLRSSYRRTGDQAWSGGGSVATQYRRSAYTGSEPSDDWVYWPVTGLDFRMDAVFPTM